MQVSPLKPRAGLAKINQYIQTLVSIAALDERAFILAGLPHDEIAEGVEHFCNELVAAFAEKGLPASLRQGFAIASADIVLERIHELQSRGVGGA